MNIIKKRYWMSDNGIWKVYGVVRDLGGFNSVEIRIMKLKNNRHEFYYGKKLPAYVLNARNSIYEELK